MSDYTLTNLDDVEDVAAKSGLAFGAHHERDGEVVQGWWGDR